MSTEENKAIWKHWEELWNGNLALIDEMIAPTFVLHDPATPGEVRGPEGFKQLVSLTRTAFPDLHITTEGEPIAEGDKVVGRWTARGTHQGDLHGMAPTGKQVTFTGIDICRIASGQVEENWSNSDGLGLLQQLGVIPAQGQAG